jgi:hypothetical protein
MLLHNEKNQIWNKVVAVTASGNITRLAISRQYLAYLRLLQPGRLCSKTRKQTAFNIPARKQATRVRQSSSCSALGVIKRLYATLIGAVVALPPPLHSLFDLSCQFLCRVTSENLCLAASLVTKPYMDSASYRAHSRWGDSHQILPDRKKRCRKSRTVPHGQLTTTLLTRSPSL